MKHGTVNIGVGYSGEVHIYMKSGGSIKEVFSHNSGHKALWDLLAKTVAGYDVRNHIPRYLEMVISGTSTSLLFKRIPFTGIVWDAINKDETKSSATFTAALLNEHKSQTSYNGEIELRMLNSSNEILASVKDSTALGDIYNSVVPGVDAVIEWKLVFCDLNTGGV